MQTLFYLLRPRPRYACHPVRNDGFLFFVHLQSQNSSPSLTNGLSGASLCFGSGLGGEGPDHLLKVPRTGCENCCFQSWSTHCSPLTHPPPHQLSLSHTHTHADARMDTDCRMCCATGDFKGAPPGLQSEPITHPARRPLSPSGRDDRLINWLAFREPCPAPARQPRSGQVSPHHPASGGPAADPNLQGSRLRRPGGQAMQATLAGCP